MGIAHSTCYAVPATRAGDAELLTAIAAICDEFEFYGWRRVQAAPAIRASSPRPALGR